MKLGTMLKGQEIGKTHGVTYFWVRCPVCGLERWTGNPSGVERAWLREHGLRRCPKCARATFRKGLSMHKDRFKGLRQDP